MDAYLEPEGCTWYCENCAPDGAESYPDGGGESDCPANCDTCHVPLRNSLTSDGVNYVLEHIRESLRAGRQTRQTIHPCYNGTYYENEQHGQIVEDWTKDITWGLKGKDKRLVELFLTIRECDRK
jgi:hypothetical protein